MKNKSYMFLSIIIILLLWKVISFIVASSIKIPSPEETLVALVTIIRGEYFLIQVGSSLKRVLIGFLISFSAGLILGVISGFVDPIYYLLKPLIITWRAVPTMAVILLSLIWLNREIAPILVGVLVILPIIYSAVVSGVRTIDKELLEMCKVYQFNYKKRFIHLYLPSIRTALMAVSATAISLNMKIVIAAEVLSQPKNSVGTGFQMEKVSLNTAGVIAWAVIAIILASLLEYLIGLVFNSVSRNRKKSVL